MDRRFGFDTAYLSARNRGTAVMGPNINTGLKGISVLHLQF